MGILLYVIAFKKGQKMKHCTILLNSAGLNFVQHNTGFVCPAQSCDNNLKWIFTWDGLRSVSFQHNIPVSSDTQIFVIQSAVSFQLQCKILHTWVGFRVEAKLIHSDRDMTADDKCVRNKWSLTWLDGGWEWLERWSHKIQPRLFLHHVFVEFTVFQSVNSAQDKRVIPEILCH